MHKDRSPSAIRTMKMERSQSPYLGILWWACATCRQALVIGKSYMNTHRQKKNAPRDMLAERLEGDPAVTYSPTKLPLQYHRRKEA